MQNKSDSVRRQEPTMEHLNDPYVLQLIEELERIANLEHLLKEWAEYGYSKQDDE